MHPILSDFRRFLLYIVACLLMGVGIARLLVVAELTTTAYALLFSLPLALLGGFLASSAYFVCRSLPIAHRRMITAVLVFGSASLISGLSWLGISHGWNMVVFFLLEDGTELQISSHLSALFFLAGFALYMLALLAFDLYIAFNNMREADQREAASRLLARDAELQVLRSQIDPHFLFNSLNSISALTAIDPASARNMTIALADFFRQTLSISEKEKISLNDELRLCENFLAVEKIRFGKKLETAFNISPDAGQALIPPMILQPLLENAIKHGIRNLPQGGIVTVTIFRRDQWLHISVQNPVGSAGSNSTGNGLGMHNLRQRFAAIYAEQARVTWQQTESEFVLEMALPYEQDRQT